MSHMGCESVSVVELTWEGSALTRLPRLVYTLTLFPHQALYGKNTNTSDDENSLDPRATATASRPQPRRQPSQGDNTDRDVSDTALCTSGRIDTMVVIDLVTYAFLGDQYWRLTSTAVEPGYPRYKQKNKNKNGKILFQVHILRLERSSR